MFFGVSATNRRLRLINVSLVFAVVTSSIACTVADNSGRPGLCSAERGDLFVP